MNIYAVALNISMTVYRQLRARRALLQFKDVPLRTRRVLSLYNVYGDSALLVLMLGSHCCAICYERHGWPFVADRRKILNRPKCYYD